MTFASPDHPRRAVKKLLLDRFVITHDPPWPILDPLKANRSELGIIYVNSVLVPRTLCTVSSCVREFWSRPYLLLSTLSRSTSWPPSTRGEERDAERERWALRGSDVCTTLQLSLRLSASWQRPFGSSVIYLCSSSLKVWPPPKTRQLTHIDALRTFITFSPNKTNKWKLMGWIWGILWWVINKIESEFCVYFIIMIKAHCLNFFYQFSHRNDHIFWKKRSV